MTERPAPKIGVIHMATGLDDPKTWCRLALKSELTSWEMTGDESFVTCDTCRALTKWSEAHGWMRPTESEITKHQKLGMGDPIDVDHFWDNPKTFTEDSLAYRRQLIREYGHS